MPCTAHPPAGSTCPTSTRSSSSTASMVVARRFDVQVTALTKQGRLATYPSAYGQEACEIGAISAIEARRLVLPDLPRQHRAAHPRHRARRHPAVVPRRLAQRVRPARAPHRLAGDAARDAGAARRRPRARGPPAAGPDRHHDVPRRRRHERGRRPRGVQLRGGVADADRVPRAEQPVRDQRAALPPDAGGDARRQGGRLRHARLPRRRQRRRGGLRGHARRRRAGALGRRPDPDRGPHVPHRGAHELRRPDALPPGARRRALEAPRPDRAPREVPASPRAPSPRRCAPRSRMPQRRSRRTRATS